jgi:DNA-binding CsgD family transcriptional regulator
LTEVLLVLVGILLAVTVGAAAEYYRQLRRVQREYEKAKEVVEDIVVSFNRQLKREAGRVEVVAYKVEAISSKGDRALKRAGEVEKQLHTLEPKIGVSLENREKMLAKLGEIDKKVRDAVASQKALTAQISDIEERARQFSMVPEKGVEAVIPIRREKALAPLTETELSVLEILALEGHKTAPEIKDRIQLSREHTARLMKKIYEEGYLERDTSKIPFKYRIKKEMEKLLKKTENQT